ncbi:MAG: glycosyltransferase family 4 protein [Candidatus Micrarchaeota archaeon]
MLDVGILGARGRRYTELAERLRAKGSKITIYPTKPSLVSLLKSRHALYHTSAFVSPAAMLWLNKLLRGKKYTLTLQGLVWKEAEEYARGKPLAALRVWLYRFFAKRALDNAEAVIAVSGWVARKLANFSEKAAGKAIPIYHAIDAGKFSKGKRIKIPGAREGDDILLYIGDFKFSEKARGVELLIDAMGKILKKRKKAKLVIVGEKEGYFNEIENYARSKPYASSVIFTGFRNDVPDLLASADVFVYASFMDGMPRTPLEAMAAGVPVVAVNACSLREEVINGKNGFLVAPRAEAIADAALRLLVDKKLARKMGEEGRRFVGKNFSLEIMANTHEKVWTSVSK